MSERTQSENLAVDMSVDLEPMLEIDDQTVRDYLLKDSGFFLRHADLLEKIELPHQEKGSVSLVEVQSKQLRKKIRQLTLKLNQLITIAKQNEKIYRVYVALNLQLMKCKKLADIQNALETVMLEELDLSCVHIYPFKGPMALPELQQRLFIEKRFKDETFFFGRLSQHEKQLLFPDQDAHSVALVLIGDDNPVGILAVGSDDASHFAPSMDTLLLRQLQQMLQILLTDILSY